MKTVFYRLNQYKLIEAENDELWWEAYGGFARTLSGKCFVRHNILFISPFSEISEPGFLINEYNQMLEKLPRWTKTKYYCHDYSIKNSNDSKTLTREEMVKWSREPVRPPAAEIDKMAKWRPGEKPAPASYRLGRYEIGGHEESGFIWKIWSELDRLKTGECFIEGDVIFLGDTKALESGVLKNDYMKHLAELPQWTRTRYYCDRYTLKICRTGASLPIQGKPETEHEVSLPSTENVNKGEWGGGREKPDDAPRAQRAGIFQTERSGFLEMLKKCRLPKGLGRRIRPPDLSLFLAGTRKHLKRFLGVGVSLTVLSLLAGGAVFLFGTMEEDKHKDRFRYQKSDDRSRRHPRRARAGAALSAESSSYRRACGGCHFAYPPDLLPSRSWQKLIAGVDNHFGEAVALEPDSKKAVTKHLMQNAADYSPAKRAEKIMESLGARNPIRITAVPYIQHKHRKIPASVLDRKSIGSLSNCPACHRSAGKGLYDEHEALIPR